MRSRRCQLLLLIALSLAPRAHATDAPKPVAFKASLGKLPIWMTLVVAADGQVTGSYFYFKYRTPIALTGKKRGAKLVMEERVDGKVTGAFILTTKPLDEKSPLWPLARGDRRALSGSWRKPGKPKALAVNGYESDPAFEVCARLNVDELMLESDESLGAELDIYRESPRAPDPDARPDERDYDITACRNGLFSTFHEWRSRAPGSVDPIHGRIRHTFDVAAKKEIDLEDQLDPGKRDAFHDAVARRIGAPHKDGPPVFYVDGDQLMIGTAIPLDDDPSTLEHVVPMPFAELAPYLRKGAVLRALAPAK